MRAYIWLAGNLSQDGWSYKDEDANKEIVNGPCSCDAFVPVYLNSPDELYSDDGSTQNINKT